jgi:sec-independent protein translocase protein TatA
VIGDILQPSHLLFILVIALLVLGPKRLPEAGRALGRGLRDFRNALNTDDLRDQMITTTTPESAPPTTQEPGTATEAAFASAPSPAAPAGPEPEAAAPAAPREPGSPPDWT